MNPTITVRELQQQDIPHIINYWSTASDEHLLRMGADRNKLPGEEQLKQALTEQIGLPYQKKQSYCIIWEVNKEAIGHSNVNAIRFGEQANMHLHMWRADLRNKGLGAELVKLTIPYFFKNLELKKLVCQPSAANISPNKTIEKVGFRLVSSYSCVPGPICFEQEINHWELDRSDFASAS